MCIEHSYEEKRRKPKKKPESEAYLKVQIFGPIDENKPVDRKRMESELKNAGYNVLVPVNYLIANLQPSTILLCLNAENCGKAYTTIREEVEEIIHRSGAWNRVEELFIPPAKKAERKRIERSSSKQSPKQMIDFGCSAC